MAFILAFFSFLGGQVFITILTKLWYIVVSIESSSSVISKTIVLNYVFINNVYGTLYLQRFCRAKTNFSKYWQIFALTSIVRSSEGSRQQMWKPLGKKQASYRCHSVRLSF